MSPNCRPATSSLFWGAVTGTIGSVVAVANLRRDRAKIHVTCQIEDRSYKYRQPPSFVIRVSNVGKQATVITEISIATKWTTTGWPLRRTSPLSGILLPWSRDDDEVARNVPPMENWDIRPRTKMLDAGEVLTVVQALNPTTRLAMSDPMRQMRLGE